ncbi:Hypothetical protein CINCED_3A015036 [Cinara cedri]|uniref:Uncharacterized protein n=1 Tax=Cinara cedri TaxID=506608 RepID=A0A5E4ND78_9HEMI|nr:Hypothetical protein CINCED_3A015036 [Cinara cedri]
MGYFRNTDDISAVFQVHGKEDTIPAARTRSNTDRRVARGEDAAAAITASVTSCTKKTETGRNTTLPVAPGKRRPRHGSASLRPTQRGSLLGRRPEERRPSRSKRERVKELS